MRTRPQDTFFPFLCTFQVANSDPEENNATANGHVATRQRKITDKVKSFFVKYFFEGEYLF